MMLNLIRVQLSLLNLIWIGIIKSLNDFALLFVEGKEGKEGKEV